MPSPAPSTSRTLLEIQALRALAVVLVLVYHVWPGRLPGGFIGVDVFFVISGFLITAHLLRSYETTGTVRLGAFWVRRIRRLLPAALLVLAVCTVALFTILPAVVREESLKQIGAAAAYVLNWMLAFNSVDYLASDNAATLVQHYWTLSVEEQFYIFWPLLLLLVGWVAVRATRGRVKATTIFGVTAVVVAVLSFGYSVWLTWYSPSFAFFATPTRAWEFAAGAIFAVIVARWPQGVERLRSAPFMRVTALPFVLGTALIVASAFVLNSESPFPGYRAAVPVLGAVLIIAGGMPRPAVFRFVGWRPVQFVGDISYSLYLWHWPLIVGLILLAGVRPSVLQGILILAATTVLAALTKRFVEDPARRAPIFANRRVPAFALAVVGALVFVSIAGVNSVVTQREIEQVAAEHEEELSNTAGCFGAHATLGGGECPDRFVMAPTVDLTAAAADIDKQDWCLTWYDQDWTSCELGDPDATNGTIAFVGDSHAAALVPALDAFFAEEGFKVITYLRFACPGLGIGTEGFDDSAIGVQERACADWSDRVRAELAARDDIDAALYTNFSSEYVDPRRPPEYRMSVDDIVETWSGVLASGKPVVYLKDPPRTDGTDVPTCLGAHAGEFAPCAQALDAAVRWDPHDDAIAQLNGQVEVIDMTDAYCDDSLCYAVIGDVVVYADSNHVSGTWVTTLMQYLGPQLLDSKIGR